MCTPAMVAAVSSGDDNGEKRQPLWIIKNDEVGEGRTQCDVCDIWYHRVCSGLPLALISQISELEAMYLPSRRISYFEKLVLPETPVNLFKTLLMNLFHAV